MSSIKDVARLAGVSISTVSRVLNNSCPVSEQKRESVERAARELGYIPNPAARSLLLRKTGVLGVVLPYATGEFFSGFLSGVDKAASENEYFLLISVSHRSDQDLRAVLTNLYKRVDGLVVWAPEMHPADAMAYVGSDVPLVFLNSPSLPDGNDMIDFDNYAGMYAITSHLIDLGHTEIAFIKGPPRAADARSRHEGYCGALRAHGIERRPELEFQGEYFAEAGYRLVSEILSGSLKPTAIMAPNDQAAFGVIQGLHEKNVSVPQQMSVTGFDDIPSAKFITPALTTARVPVHELGELAVRTLISRIDGRDQDMKEFLPVELVARRSSASPPAKTRAGTPREDKMSRLR